MSTRDLAGIRQELLREFCNVLQVRVPAHRLRATDMIVVLSGRVVTRRGVVTSKERENRGRTRYATDLQRRIDRERKRNHQSRRNRVTPLLLIGTTEQLDDLFDLTVEASGISPIKTASCGPIGKANTKTQMTVLGEMAGSASHVTLITSRFHVPRVIRTADRWLPQHLSFTVLGAPLRATLPVQPQSIKGEIERIIEYAKRGDLVLHPSRGGLPK